MVAPSAAAADTWSLDDSESRNDLSCYSSDEECLRHPIESLVKHNTRHFGSPVDPPKARPVRSRSLSPACSLATLHRKRSSEAVGKASSSKSGELCMQNAVSVKVGAKLVQANGGREPRSTLVFKLVCYQQHMIAALRRKFTSDQFHEPP